MYPQTGGAGIGFSPMKKYSENQSKKKGSQISLQCGGDLKQPQPDTAGFHT